MNKIFLTQVLLLMGIVNAKAQSYVSVHHEAGKECYVFADTAFVREGAGTHFPVTDTVYLGTLVTIKSSTDQLLKLRGMEAPWLEIVYSGNGVQDTGFIWSGLLSFNPLRRGNTKFIYGLERIRTDKKTIQGETIPVKEFQFRLKVMTSDTLVHTESIAVDSESAAYFVGSVTGSKGLKDVQNMVALEFSGEACGIPSLSYHYAWTGKKLLPLIMLTDIADADVFYYTEQLLFPSDREGKKDMIVMISETGEQTEKLNAKGEPEYKIKKEKKLFSWNGEKLSPVKN